MNKVYRFRKFIAGPLKVDTRIRLSRIKHFINYGPYTQILVESGVNSMGRKQLTWMCVDRSYEYFKNKMSEMDSFRKIRLEEFPRVG